MSLHENLNSLHDRGVSLATRTITVEGEVDQAMAMRLYKNLNALTQRSSTAPITVLLNSGGGEVQQAMAIYDLLRTSAVEIHIHVLGECQSAAAIILQAGDVRKAYEHSVIMYHQGEAGVGNMAYSEVSNNWAWTKRLCERADDVIYGRMRSADSKLTRPRFQRMLTTGIYLSAAEAIEAGLLDVDGVIE